MNFQAYCEEINNNRVLNVNLIHYDKSEPTRISDILQQEKDIKELNIYCNKKHEIYAHQEDKKRYYEIKKGACYEMTSTWPVENGSRMCTMIMNVSSDGITEVLKFDGKDFVSSKEILELIKQNDELYIQGLSLHDAVMKSLEKDKAADVVPTANNNLQNEFIRINQDKEPGENLKLECDADNSSPPFSINSNVSTQTEVNLQQIATQTEVDSQQAETGTQTEIDSQPIATQTKVNLQHTETQPEVASQQTETQTELSLQEVAIQTEVDLQHTETQTEVASQHIGIQTEINSQQITDLQSESEKAKQRIEELERQNSDLQGRFGKEEQKNTKLQAELAQKDEKLASALAELQGKAQELKSVCEAKGKLRQELEVVNAKKEELKSELKKLKKELSQVQKESEDKLKELEKEIDQAAHIMKEKEQYISNLKYQMLGLENKYKAQLESYEQEINKLKWEIRELENRYDEFKEHVASTVESMDREHEDEIKELEEKHDALSDIIADKVWEIEDLKSALQNSEKEKEFFHGQVEELSEETVADKQKGFNDQFYTLTGNISSKSDNVPRKKIELSRSLSFNSESDNESYVPLKEKTTLRRSSSVDDGYGSDKENCDDDLSSNISPISSIEKVAERVKSK